MAGMQSDGVQEIVRNLQKANLFTDENVKMLLSAGADVLLEAARSGFLQSGHHNPGQPRRTGKTYQNITRARAVRKDKSGAPYMFVTVRGKDKRGERYGAKAFVLNYGRRRGGKIPADYYWSAAIRNKRQAANDKMAELAAELLKGD